MVEVGQPAPEFTLPDQSGNAVTLSRLKGSPIVLYFGLVQKRPFQGNTSAVRSHGADRPRAWACQGLGGASGVPGSGACEPREAQQLQPMRVRPTGQQFRRCLALTLRSLAPLQHAVVQEELEQVQVVRAEMAAQAEVGS